MNPRYSFEYVFLDLLEVIDIIKIEYGHEEEIITMEDPLNEVYDISGTKWELLIKRFANNRFSSEFDNYLETIIEKIQYYVQKEQLALFMFYKTFIQELESRKLIFEQFSEGKLTILDLVNEGKIELNYSGYNMVDLMQRPEDIHKAEFDEFSYDEIFKQAKPFISKIIRYLKKLILYLGHELNLSNNQKGQIEKKGRDNELIELIEKSKIEELFQKLKSLEEYRNKKEVILLSARYFNLEKDYGKGIMRRDEYNIQRNKICDSLINLVVHS